MKRRVEDINYSFCSLAATVFGQGWMQIAAAVGISGLRNLRAYGQVPGMRPTDDEALKLIAAAQEKMANIQADIDALELNLKDGK